MKQIYLLLFVMFAVPLFGQSGDSDENKIKAKVRSFYNANKKVLLGESVDNALKGEPNSDDIKQGSQNELARSKKILNDLKLEGIEYSKGKIQKIDFSNFDLVGDKATIVGIAQYRLTFKEKSGAPEFTQYDEIRKFTFKKDKNRWILESDEFFPLGIELNTLPSDSISIEQLPRVSASPANKYGKEAKPKSRNKSTNRSSRDGNNKGGGPSMPWEDYVISGTYSKSTAAQYARNHALSHSDNYRSYSNDCTNFISQCLKDGGWTHESGSGRKSNDAWYYGSFTWTTSYTWAGAHNHYFFHKNSGRSFAGNYISDLILGDVMHVDFEGDGHIDHTVIVSYESSSGTDYVSYHTTNTLNKPVSQFISDCGSSAKFYVWCLYSSF